MNNYITNMALFGGLFSKAGPKYIPDLPAYRFNLTNKLANCGINDFSAGYPARFMDAIDFVLPKLNMNVGPWLAGGAIRRLFEKNHKEGDFDIYCKGPDQFETICDKFYHMPSGHGSWKKIIETKNAVTFSVSPVIENEKQEPYTIQIIKRYFGNTPEKIIGSFDFTNSQLLTDGEILLVGQTTLDDIKNRTLIMNNIVSGISGVRRLMKFENEGYRVSNDLIREFLEIIHDDKDLIAKLSYNE